VAATLSQQVEEILFSDRLPLMAVAQLQEQHAVDVFTSAELEGVAVVVVTKLLAAPLAPLASPALAPLAKDLREEANQAAIFPAAVEELAAADLMEYQVQKAAMGALVSPHL